MRDLDQPHAHAHVAALHDHAFFFRFNFPVLPFAAQCVRLCGIEVRILLTINEI